MALPVKAVQNNTAPSYQITCQRDDGTVINLTNCTIKMKLFQGTIQTNTTSGHDACTIVNAATGVISWQPKTGDLPTPGTYKGDVYVTYSDNTVEVLYGFFLLKARKLQGT